MTTPSATNRGWAAVNWKRVDNCSTCFTPDRGRSAARNRRRFLGSQQSVARSRKTTINLHQQFGGHMNQRERRLLLLPLILLFACTCLYGQANSEITGI